MDKVVLDWFRSVQHHVRRSSFIRLVDLSSFFFEIFELDILWTIAKRWKTSKISHDINVILTIAKKSFVDTSPLEFFKKIWKIRSFWGSLETSLEDLQMKIFRLWAIVKRWKTSKISYDINVIPTIAKNAFVGTSPLEFFGEN